MNNKSFLLSILLFLVQGLHAHNKQIVVVVTSYNNALYYQKNLDSIFSQDYDNFSVIYIDDCSPDGTAALVESYIALHGQQARCILIKNSYNESQMANHYKAVHMCPDDAIIVHIDGDDWLAHDHVLSYINDVYSSEDVWLTYGQTVEYPAGNISFARELYPDMISHNAFRDYPFIFNHLRTFYAWLFKQIKLQDLMYEGTFYGMNPAPDAAFMYPMTEMAGTHVKFIDEVLYVKYCQNPLSQITLNAQRQQNLDDTIRSWPKYRALEQKQASPKKLHKKTAIDCLLISSNTTKTNATIKSLEKYCSSLGAIYIVPMSERGSSHDHRCRLYTSTQIAQYLRYVMSDYVLIISDDQEVIKDIDLDWCALWLEQTAAYAFYLGTTSEAMPDCVQRLYEPLYAWSFLQNQEWRSNLHTINGAVYHKNRCLHVFDNIRNISRNSLENFLKAWQNDTVPGDNVGLLLPEVVCEH